MSAAPGDATAGGPEQPKGPPPLRTEARPFGLHWAVDTVVIFLATIVVALIFGIPWLVVAVASVVLGIGAARYTRRIDERAMLTRREG